jgi:ankyrin repeat protein
MMVAGEEDHGDVVEFLISKGADIAHAEVHGYMPITRAFWKGNEDIVRLYKRHGAACQDPKSSKDTEENYKRCMDIHD